MGKKNECAIPTPQGYLEKAKPIFKKLFNDAKEKFKLDYRSDAPILNKIYNELLDIDNTTADAFGLYVKESFAEDVYVTSIDVPFEADNITQKEQEALLFINEDLMSNYNDVNDIFNEVEQDEFKEGVHNDYSQNEYQSSTIVHVSDNPDWFKNRFFKAIGTNISVPQYSKIMEESRKLSFNAFLDYVIDKFPKVKNVEIDAETELMNQIFGEQAVNKIKDPKKLQALKNLHIYNQPENRKTRKQKEFYLIINWDGKQVLPEGLEVLQQRGEIDFKNKRQLPFYISTSFIDVSKNKVMGGKTVGEVTAYMSLNDMVVLKQGKDNWYAKSTTKNYTEAKLNSWLKQLIEKGMTIATLKGGNSATIILTKIQDSMYKRLISEEAIKGFKNQIDAKFYKDYLEKNNFNFGKAIRDWKKVLDANIAKKGPAKFKKEVQIYVIMENLQRRLAIVGFDNYLINEVKNKNISEDDFSVFLRNIVNLPVKGTKNKVTGIKEPYIHMIDYLTSIVARHEYLKAVRGNTYTKRQSLEDIFNRMRLAAAEGIVNLKADKKSAIIYDESKVYFKNTETGERIEPQQIIPGMRGKQDIADGQLFMDSESINEISEAIGRQGVLEYEHNPKEIKIVQYNLEQTEEGQEDNYIETKQMAFLGEPGFEIVDSTTDKVIVSTVKESDEFGQESISMYAGAATENPGSKINQVMSLNEAKNLSGKYAFDTSHNLIELPANATRTIILPSTKSHTDAAQGATWVNSFNINEPIYNNIRKKLINFYQGIVDNHIDVLHKVSTDPDYARNFLRFQTRIREDATNEIQSLSEISDRAVHHPAKWKIFRTSIFNSIILNNAMKVRLTLDRNNPTKITEGASSSFKLKSDILNRIKLNKKGIPEGFLVGAGNDRIFNYVSDLYMQSLVSKVNDKFKDDNLTAVQLREEMSKARREFIDLNKNQKVNTLNAYLKENPIIANGVRQPVQHIGGSIFRPILGFLPDVGDALVAHPKDVTFQWIGDSDGDTVNLNIYPDQGLASEIMELLESKALENEQTATSDLNIFEHAENTHPGSYTGFVKTMLSAVQYNGGQGIITNLKTTASVLELKLGDNPIILEDGTEIKIIKSKDMVVMNYAPLKKDVTSKDLPAFAKIVNKDGSAYDGVGKKYLKTTAQHERLLLLNAATDNTKEHLLGKVWNINFDTEVKRIFKRVDGIDLTPKQIKALKEFKDIFNYSKIRSGRDSLGNKLDDDAWYFKSKALYDFLTSDNKESQLQYINRLMDRSKIKIKDITISKEMTVDEMLISRPYQKMLEFYGATNIISPLRYSKNKTDLAHDAAISGFEDESSGVKIQGLNQKLKAIQASLKFKGGKEVKEAARKFGNEFAAAWEQQLRDTITSKNKFAKEPTSQIYSYDESMNKFLIPYRETLKNQLEKYGEDFRLLFSYRALLGLGDVKRRNLLFPHDFYTPQIIDAYFTSWENVFFSKDKEGLNILDSRRAVETARLRIPDVTNDKGRCQ